MTEWLTVLPLCFINYAKAFDCVDHMDHNDLWKIPKREGNTRPPYLSPEKPVCKTRSNSTGHETTVGIQSRKGGRQGCILSPFFLNLYIESIIQNARLDEDKLGSTLLGDTSTTSDTQRIPLHSNSRKWRGTEKPPDKDERAEWKSWLETQHSKA